MNNEQTQAAFGHLRMDAGYEDDGDGHVCRYDPRRPDGDYVYWDEIVHLLAELLELREQAEKLKADAARLDWIADKNNGYAALQLPGECVRRNLHSMRDAIDDAMAMEARENGKA